jgi:hypothetical protein
MQQHSMPKTICACYDLSPIAVSCPESSHATFLDQRHQEPRGTKEGDDVQKLQETCDSNRSRGFTHSIPLSKQRSSLVWVSAMGVLQISTVNLTGRVQFG